MKSKLLALPLLLVACGGLDPNPSDRAPLATLVGQLSSSSNVTVSNASSNVRVALLWGRGDQGSYQTSTDLPVQPVFPSKFQLTLREGPPPAMMFNPFIDDGVSSAPPQAGSPPEPEAPPAPGSVGTMSLQLLKNDPALANVKVGIATVVAYEDRNGNGKLDFVDEGATTFVDRIVAANPELLVVYMDGAVPVADDLRDEQGALPSPGYNLLRRGTPCVRVATSDGSLPTQENCTTTRTTWLSMSTVFDLPLTNSPSVNRWMCKSETAPSVSSKSGAIPKQGRPATYPTVGDPKLSCSQDGSMYTYGTPPTCTTEYFGVCRGSETTCAASEALELWQRPNPVPSDWPCK